MECSAGASAEIRELPFQGCDKMREKTLGIVVQFIERKPAHGEIHLVSGVDHEGGFPIPGWGCDQQEFVFQKIVNQGKETPAGKPLGALFGEDNFRLGNWNFHTVFSIA